MNLTILDRKYEADATCYLCRVSLTDYIKSIPSDYQEFDIQRGIVNNKYLDFLVDTVGKKRHIPPIVLVSDNEEITGDIIKLYNYKILDGLQRTHRLKQIYDAIEIIVSHKDIYLSEDNISSYYRTYSSEFKRIGVNRQLVKSLSKYKTSTFSSPIDFFENNTIWIEIWCGLSDDMQIRKMLLLNAGHKSVNIKHQLELLFLGTLLKLNEISGEQVSFKREKDISAIQYSKDRSLGEYHFSHIISALISFHAGKIVNTNADFIGSLQSGDLPEIELTEEFNVSIRTKFTHFILNLDRSLNREYGKDGLRWLGREVVLVGFFGALGAFAKQNSIELSKLLDDLEPKIDVNTRIRKRKKSG